MLITIALTVLFALATLHWFARQGGASGPGPKPVDLVLLAGLGLACWVGYLVVSAILPLLIAVAFAVGVELYIRERRKLWRGPDASPRRQAQPAQPTIARAHRIHEPAPQLDARTPQALPTATSRPAIGDMR